MEVRRYPGKELPDSVPSYPRTWGLQILLAVILCLAMESGQAQLGAVKARQVPWQDADGRALNVTVGDLESWLAEGIVVAAKPISGTAARPVKVTLETGQVRLLAVFRHVNEFRQQMQTRQGLRLNYRDSALFEVAAYRLDRLLHVGRVPPTVRRKLSAADFAGSDVASVFPSLDGTLQAWVPGAITEGMREEQGLRPPVGREWAFEFQVMQCFDNLIFNDDRNRGNLLVDDSWHIWLIDATRAFRPMHWLPFPDRLRLCERRIWDRLVQVEDDVVRAELSEYLTTSELDGLLERRKLVVEEIRKRIRQWGDKAVLFDRPGPLYGTESDG